MKKNRNAGFSLLEIIIAMAILAIVTVPVMGVFIQIARVDSKAKMTQKATDLAQNMMEGIREYTMAEILYQCTNANGLGIDFLSDCLPDYKPDGYKYVSAGSNNEEFESNILKGFKDGTIYGEYDNTSDQTIVTAIKGVSTMRLAFLGVNYNNSTFDIVCSFNIIKDASDTAATEEYYYLYDVDVSVYQIFGDDHFSSHLATVSGGVMNNNESFTTGDPDTETLDKTMGEGLLKAINNYLCNIVKLKTEHAGQYKRIRLSYDVNDPTEMSPNITDLYGVAHTGYPMRIPLEGQSSTSNGKYRVLVYIEAMKQNDHLNYEVKNYLASDNPFNTKDYFDDWSKVEIYYLEAYLKNDYVKNNGTLKHNEDEIQKVVGYQIVQTNSNGKYTVYTKTSSYFKVEKNMTAEGALSSETAYTYGI